MESRYEFDALQAAVGIENVSHLAEHLEVERTQIYRWKRNGLNFDRAEVVAVKLGTVPELVWPAWREEADANAHALEERDREREQTRLERQRAAGRRHKARRRQDPEFRERNRLYLQEYRRQYGDGLRAWRRAYYQRNRQREIARAVERKRERRQEREAS